MKPSLLLIAGLIALALAMLLFQGVGSPADGVPSDLSVATSAPSIGSDEIEESLVRVAQEAERTTTFVSAVESHESKAVATIETLLVVRVVNKRGAPVVGAKVVCNGGSNFVSSDRERLSSRGGILESLHTDETGRCTVNVPPQTPIYVLVTPVDEHFHPAQAEHAGLMLGEVVEVEVIAAALDGWFHGVVLAAEDGTPISGASIRPHDGAKDLRLDGSPLDAMTEASATTDAAGTYEINLAAWGNRLVYVINDGRSPVLFEVDPAFDRPLNAKAVRLPLAARLVGRLQGIDDATRAVRIEATCSLYHLGQPVTDGLFVDSDPVWSCVVSNDGRFELTGLPPELPLDLTVVQDREVLMRLPTPSTFTPAESRKVDWDLRASATMRVTVVDSEGAPQPNVEVGLFPGGEVFGDWIQPRFETVRQSRSDASGHVEWKDLPPGVWAIGPTRQRGGSGRAISLTAPAPVLTRVTVGPEADDIDVRLMIHRGLTIRGTIRGPEDEPPDRAFVSASRLGSGLNVTGTAREDGTFLLGPLLPGRYRIRVTRYNHPLWCQADEPVVEAGAQDVDVQLVSGGSVRVRLLNADTGERPEGMIWIHPVDGTELGGISIGASADVVLGGLRAGAYHLSGGTWAGAIGVLRDVQVQAGQEEGPLDVILQPTGRLRVYYSGPSEHASYSIRQDGVIVSSDGIQKGTSTIAAAPFGTVEVLLTMRAESTGPGMSSQSIEHSQTAEITEGKQADVEFRIGDEKR